MYIHWVMANCKFSFLVVDCIPMKETSLKRHVLNHFYFILNFEKNVLMRCWKYLSSRKEFKKKKNCFGIWSDFGSWVRLKTFQHLLNILCKKKRCILFEALGRGKQGKFTRLIMNKGILNNSQWQREKLSLEPSMF